MPKTKLIAPVTSVAMLSFVLATHSGQAATQPRPSFLLKAPCANAGPGNWGLNDLNVSIGRAVYKSLFFMGAGDRFASLTCKIRLEDSQPLFQTLQLGFGMRDIERSSPPTVVSIYLDGKPTVSRNVSPGQKVSLSLDVINVSNIAIDTICSSQSRACDRVYFFDASLERIPPLPKQ